MIDLKNGKGEWLIIDDFLKHNDFHSTEKIRNEQQMVLFYQMVLCLITDTTYHYSNFFTYSYSRFANLYQTVNQTMEIHRYIYLTPSIGFNHEELYSLYIFNGFAYQYVYFILILNIEFYGNLGVALMQSSERTNDN